MSQESRSHLPADEGFFSWRVVGYDTDSGKSLFDEGCRQPSEVSSTVTKRIAELRHSDRNCVVGILENRLSLGWPDIAHWRTGSPELLYAKSLVREPIDQVLNEIAESTQLPLVPEYENKRPTTVFWKFFEEELPWRAAKESEVGKTLGQTAYEDAERRRHDRGVEQG